MNKPKTTARKRHKVPLYVMLPPLERDRVHEFAAQVDRPLSWVVRDALKVYLHAAEQDAQAFARLRVSVTAPAVDLAETERTPPEKIGRPPNPPTPPADTAANVR